MKTHSHTEFPRKLKDLKPNGTSDLPNPLDYLPTLDRLGASIPPNFKPLEAAELWFSRFTERILAKDPKGVVDLFTEDSHWRDVMACTWDMRTFSGVPRISKFLHDVLPKLGFSNLKLRQASVNLLQMGKNLFMLRGLYDFETDTGLALGIFHLVPTSIGEWKFHLMFTNIEDLKGFPEEIGERRPSFIARYNWEEKRERELLFEDTEPTVLIVGAGHLGLQTAARLKMLGVTSLLVEKNARVGDPWRNRYETLCLHDAVWFDHFPYLPFPKSWPIYTPAGKLVDWLECYAKIMELNVRTSSEVQKFEQNPDGEGWIVTVKRSDGSIRKFRPRHLQLAIGNAGNLPRIPDIPGMDIFKGEMVHSVDFRSAKPFKGKKVIVIGSCTSAHDIALDLYDCGADVLMVQRSSTYVMSAERGAKRFLRLYWGENNLPTDLADRLFTCIPYNFLKYLSMLMTKEIAEGDRELLDGLRKAGFNLNLGIEGAGALSLIRNRAGGFYIDVGASQRIIEGKIKLKSGCGISRFEDHHVVFEDGTKLYADALVFATGYGNILDAVKKMGGEELVKKIKRPFGLNEEGETNNYWRECGIPRLYFTLGNISGTRPNSKYLALRIKAIEEGVKVVEYPF